MTPEQEIAFLKDQLLSAQADAAAMREALELIADEKCANQAAGYSCKCGDKELLERAQETAKESLSTPNPGSKLMRVVEAARRCANDSWFYVSKELDNALAELDRGK